MQIFWPEPRSFVLAVPSKLSLGNFHTMKMTAGKKILVKNLLALRFYGDLTRQSDVYFFHPCWVYRVCVLCVCVCMMCMNVVHECCVCVCVCCLAPRECLLERILLVNLSNFFYNWSDYHRRLSESTAFSWLLERYVSVNTCMYLVEFMCQTRAMCVTGSLSNQALQFSYLS